MSLVGTSLTAASSTAVGSILSFDTPRLVSMQVIINSGSPSYSINIEGSLDGTNFSTIGRSVDQGSGPFIVSLILTSGSVPIGQGVPVLFARANLISISGGTITAIIAALD
jgi:hypothetical protein